MEDIMSDEDPYVWEIARVRREGEVAALRDRICKIQHNLSNHAWEDTVRSGRYHKLGEAIMRAEHELKNMRMLLDAIRSIDQLHS